MPNILKAPAKVHAARSFLNNFYDAGGSDRIYIGLGDAGGEWGTPSAPDTPIDSFDEEEAFWANLVGMGEVSQATDTDLLVPRKTWESGTTYAIFNEAADTGSGTFDTVAGRDFYVVNTELSPKVYKLTATSGNPANAEPVHTDPTGVDDGSGNVWSYLYTIGGGADVSGTMLSDTWMPVPSTAQSYSNPLPTTIGDLCFGDGSTGYPASQIFQVHATLGDTNGADMALDTNNTWVKWTADQDLGAFYVGCTLAFPDSAGTGGEIPNSTSYRQVALLRNPLDSSGNLITTQWKGSGFETTLSRGVVLTLDNRVTVTRSVGQTETVRLILEF